MSTLEINKIIAAVLTAGIIASFSGFVAEILMHPQELEENVYVVAGAAGEAAGQEAAPAEGATEDIGVLLATADPAAGQKEAKKCAACHTFDEGAANKQGPNLWNVVNRPIASVAGFGYSSALQGLSDQLWSYEDLNGYLTKPKDFAPGTKMSFAGIKKAEARANLIAYLRSLSDDPAPLPE